MVNGEYALLLHNALHSPDKEIADAALRTKNWLDENFSVAGGDYYVIIDAKVLPFSYEERRTDDRGHRVG